MQPHFNQLAKSVIDRQPIVSFVPMLMFAILFGLSMDYNVFLISTAGIIMTLVFLGFMMTTETEVKMEH